jgi:hypothetical protein
MAAYNLVGINDRVQLDLFGTLTRQRRLLSPLGPMYCIVQVMSPSR